VHPFVLVDHIWLSTEEFRQGKDVQSVSPGGKNLLSIVRPPTLPGPGVPSGVSRGVTTADTADFRVGGGGFLAVGLRSGQQFSFQNEASAGWRTVTHISPCCELGPLYYKRYRDTANEVE
jgi:hypothetical protein